jgi:hypothetical protein
MFVSCYEMNASDFEGSAKDALKQRSLTSSHFGMSMGLEAGVPAHNGGAFTNCTASTII